MKSYKKWCPCGCGKKVMHEKFIIKRDNKRLSLYKCYLCKRLFTLNEL